MDHRLWTIDYVPKTLVAITYELTEIKFDTKLDFLFGFCFTFCCLSGIYLDLPDKDTILLIVDVR